MTAVRAAGSLLMTPSGRMFDEDLALELAAEPELTLLCGRYEGVDERVREHLCTDAISIGRYVLAGGELAAMVVADAVLRKLPGALGHADSAREEVVLGGSRGQPRVPALHATARLQGLGSARRAAVRRPRPGRAVAARAQPRTGRAARARRLATIPGPRGPATAARERTPARKGTATKPT